MTSSSRFKKKPGLDWMVTGHFFWLLTTALIGGWWGFLVLKQAKRITQLEAQIGIDPQIIQDRWQTTQRMLYWESSALLALVVISTALLMKLYWRELSRTRALQSFFASVTHELRTPLTSIRLQAESLADDKKGDVSQLKLVRRLLEDTARLEGQVERTLELARLEGGGPIFTQSISLKPSIERALWAWRETYQDRAKIELNLADFTVNADASAVQVILRNLLENSIKHSGHDLPTIWVEARHNKSWIEVIVRDNGTPLGIHPRKLGKLFEKGSKSQGAGVGLYLVGILMQKMGGRAEFIPGSTGFSVHLFFRGVDLDGRT